MESINKYVYDQQHKPIAQYTLPPDENDEITLTYLAHTHFENKRVQKIPYRVFDSWYRAKGYLTENELNQMTIFD